MRSAPFLVFLSLLSVSTAHAADWTLRLDAASTAAYGNDRHGLTIRSRDTSGTPVIEGVSAIQVENARSMNFGLGLRRVEGHSGWGFDFFYFGVTADGILSNASGTATNEVTFAASDQSYSSSSAADVLYYQLRDDNRLEMWTGDVYYIRALKPGLELQAGVRFGDFDNDYRSVLGVEGTEGTFLDTGSNYPRMMGPLVAISGRLVDGRHSVEAYAGQSLIVGRASLGYTSRHFTGSPSAPTVDEVRNLEDKVQAVIPITDLRLHYRFALTEHWSLGAGATTSAWWDVPVPPGVEPDADAAQALHENTVVLYSVLASVEWKF